MRKSYLVAICITLVLANGYSLYKYNELGRKYMVDNKDKFINLYRSNSYTISNSLIGSGSILTEVLPDSLIIKKKVSCLCICYQ